MALFRRRPHRRTTPTAREAQERRERTAALAVELRLLSVGLRRAAAELASVHGVERRNGENGAG